MNLSLQQALKYGTKEDLIASAVHSGKRDPVALLVAADAHEEAGEEGTADLLRKAAEKGQEKWPSHLYPHSSGTKTYKSLVGNYFDNAKGVSGSLEVLATSDSSPPASIGMRLRLKGEPNYFDAVYPKQEWRVNLTPQEAKEATARLPNAEEIHQFIDHHFPEPKSAN